MRFTVLSIEPDDHRLTAELARMAPVMLLDEIAAHLDTHRRAALFDILDELNGQGRSPSTGESGARTTWVTDQILRSASV